MNGNIFVAGHNRHFLLFMFTVVKEKWAWKMKTLLFVVGIFNNETFLETFIYVVFHARQPLPYRCRTRNFSHDDVFISELLIGRYYRAAILLISFRRLAPDILLNKSTWAMQFASLISLERDTRIFLTSLAKFFLSTRDFPNRRDYDQRWSWFPREAYTKWFLNY